MKLKLLATLFFIAFTSLSIAATPPKAFLSENICTYEGNHRGWGEVGELVQCLQEYGNSLSWEKTSNGWILSAKKVDKLTGKANRTKLQFNYLKIGNDKQQYVYLTRMVINNQDAERLAPILASPAINACWKKANAAEAAWFASEKKRREEDAKQKERDEETKKIAEKAAENKKKLEEAKENERELEQKRQTVINLAGMYSNDYSKNASLDIKNISTDKISFSLKSKAQSGAAIINCVILNKEAIIAFPYGKAAQATFGSKEDVEEDRKNGCFITFSFDEDTVSVMQDGGCAQYCGRIGDVSGRYNKEH